MSLALSIDWESHSTIGDLIDPPDFVYTYDGTINTHDEDANEILVGRCVVYYVAVGAVMDVGEDLFEVMDGHSHNVYQYFEPIFGDDAPSFKQELIERLDFNVEGADLLIIDRLEILPQFRGQLIGLTALRHAMERFRLGAGLVALKPFPLQFEGALSELSREYSEWRRVMALDQFGQDEKSSTEKLRRYYGKLGFVDRAGSDIMLFPTALRIPTLEDIRAELPLAEEA